MRSGRRLPARLLLAWLYVAAVCALPTWLHWHAPRAVEPAPEPADVLARWRAEYFAEQQGLAGVHVDQRSAHVPHDELDSDASHAASALALFDAACAHVRSAALRPRRHDAALTTLACASQVPRPLFGRAGSSYG